MKDEILKQLMDDLESYYLPNQLTNDLAVYYPPSIDGMESIEDIIKESSYSDLQLRLIALKEFILNEKQTDANLYRPLYNDEFGDIELDIIEHYIKWSTCCFTIYCEKCFRIWMNSNFSSYHIFTSIRRGSS